MACELECGDIFDYTNFLLVVRWNRASISNGLRDISIQGYIKHGLDLLGSCDLIGHVTIWYPRYDFL